MSKKPQQKKSWWGGNSYPDYCMFIPSVCLCTKWSYQTLESEGAPLFQSSSIFLLNLFYCNMDEWVVEFS